MDAWSSTFINSTVLDINSCLQSISLQSARGNNPTPLLDQVKLDDDNSASNIHTRESIQKEVDATFTSELACTAFVQFCRLCGE